jgi:CBS domain-containing protein
MICPNCGHDNIPGEDYCTECQADLRDLDGPRPKTPLQKRILEDKLQVLCTHPPTTVPADTKLRTVVELMRKKRIGSVVVGTKEPLEGILTERDILYKIAGKEIDLDTATVGEFMTPNPATVTTDQPIARALYSMSAIGVRHLPLMKDGKLIEVLSAHDILNYLHEASGNSTAP